MAQTCPTWEAPNQLPNQHIPRWQAEGQHYKTGTGLGLRLTLTFLYRHHAIFNYPTSILFERLEVHDRRNQMSSDGLRIPGRFVPAPPKRRWRYQNPHRTPRRHAAIFAGQPLLRDGEELEHLSPWSCPKCHETRTTRREPAPKTK